MLERMEAAAEKKLHDEFAVVVSQFRNRAQDHPTGPHATLAQLVRTIANWHEAGMLSLDWLRPHLSSLEKLSGPGDYSGAVYAEAMCQLLAGMVEALPNREASEARVREVVDAQFKGAMSTIRKHVDEAKEAENAASAAAATAGAETQTKHFAERAAAHTKASYGWMVTALVAFAGWTVAAYYIAVTMPSPASWPDVAVRVLGLSAGLAMVSVAVRAYSANRHNAVVNEHRSTAINTMRSFIAATSNEATKNAVILQVTAGTFAAMPTGYEGRSGVALPQTGVLELLKTSKK